MKYCMPSSSKKLRDQFMCPDDEGNFNDGIGTCEEIIRAAGGEVSSRYMITYTGHDEHVWEAINYLLNEWDYGLMP